MTTDAVTRLERAAEHIGETAAVRDAAEVRPAHDALATDRGAAPAKLAEWRSAAEVMVPRLQR
jgi:hypothetical protein